MLLVFYTIAATSNIYTLSLHDALPICRGEPDHLEDSIWRWCRLGIRFPLLGASAPLAVERQIESRSEEHTSELQSRSDLVCRLLLEKKNVRYAIVASYIACTIRSLMVI